MEVSPECGERLPTGKSVGVSEERQRLFLGDAPVVSAFGWLFRAAMEHSRALRLQGRRPLVPMCRSVGEAGDWGGGRDFAVPAKERMSRLRQ
ncbi:hypothetical protein B296_00017437 [Ensete ventricosum]|uniref:Uncharacterized protein n=1 Tax=Ensete ventricosum TaxID=4639 RepID=A0A427AP23_ENSVE|nr:hypothetical protein B296_00017437 [Ensete ventricosum]